jgi:hypothetical protein
LNESGRPTNQLFSSVVAKEECVSVAGYRVASINANGFLFQVEKHGETKIDVAGAIDFRNHCG